ncbi:unnamed protein product [Chrysoparadoxa australica]
MRAAVATCLLSSLSLSLAFSATQSLARAPVAPPAQTSYNVVLTHTTADFDSLASAVGLCKLWQLEDPKTPTYVVLPNGAHPSVAEYCGLHMELFPIRRLTTLSPSGCQKIGLCDAQTRSRFGPGSDLIDEAQKVFIYDHHSEQNSDFFGDNVVITCEPVGSVSTMIAERLKNLNVELNEAEATLLSLGIHADTGSLTFGSTTARDCMALAWLMEHGSQQHLLSEFLPSQSALSEDQQACLVEAMQQLQISRIQGVKVATVALSSPLFVKGMARVAQQVLDTTEVDCLLLAHQWANKQNKPRSNVSIIGRARSRASVDLNVLLAKYGGGGHAKAAAATARVTINEEGETAQGDAGQAQLILDELLQELRETQLLQREQCAEDFMVAMKLMTCGPDETVLSVDEKLAARGIYACPVVDSDTLQVLGIITRSDTLKMLNKGKSGVKQPVKGVMQKHYCAVGPQTPLSSIKKGIMEQDSGRAIVEDSQGRFLGIITRTQLLQQLQLYKNVPTSAQDNYREFFAAKFEGAGVHAEAFLECMG